MEIWNQNTKSSEKFKKSDWKENEGNKQITRKFKISIRERNLGKPIITWTVNLVSSQQTYFCMIQ